MSKVAAQVLAGSEITGEQTNKEQQKKLAFKELKKMQELKVSFNKERF